MATYHIHINGIVQGVGFRPMVYKLAQKMQLKGTVRNSSDGVHISFNASQNTAHSFFEKILQSAPASSRILMSRLFQEAATVFADFSIVVDSDDRGDKQVLCSPDIAICASCSRELHTKGNARFRYPFITCAQCGPRYSIMHRLPYDRHVTSMQDFTMCSTCREEYDDVADRRFFSQTNSCATCGIGLRIQSDATTCLSDDAEEVLGAIKDFLLHGNILAVKGIGGYLLLCDANNAEVVQLLRSRKHRPSKPFAILYPDIGAVRRDFELNEAESSLLEGEAAPIVLLVPRPAAYARPAVDLLAPRLGRLGIMLPCSPLLELIAQDYGKPLIATSANISGSPLLYKDEEALACLFEVADYVVSYNREIIVPQDDSVVQVAPFSHQLILLRRSRGYSPCFLSYQPREKACILGTGAFLKGTFTLSVNGNVLVSQFLGSGDRYESQQMYRDVLEHWLRLYQAKPAVVLADLHPDYFSHRYARELAGKYGATLKLIQHHEAHFAAVLAENNLLHPARPVLGVIWDGTGLGTDGNIWGGEFFSYENKKMLRYTHFDYFPAIAGDKLSQEPRLAALCATGPSLPSPDLLREKFTEAEWNNYQSLIAGATLFTSSVGRLFDAVASLLGLCDKQSYEGEAALYLQVLAEEYVRKEGFIMEGSYFKEADFSGATFRNADFDGTDFGSAAAGGEDFTGAGRIPTAALLRAVLSDIRKGERPSYIAAKFHYSLVWLIGQVARQPGVEEICFSGGVFQNALLVDWIQKEYRDKYRLYFHKSLSANDENISFGQLVYYENKISSVGRKDWVAEKMGHY